MVDFTVLVLPGSFGAGTAAVLDILQAACALAPAQRASTPRWQVCSPLGGAVRLQSGLMVDTVPLPSRERTEPSTWIIPGLAVDRPSALDPLLGRDDVQQVAAAIAQHVDHGGRVAACCSAVFLLHQAGLLSGRRVTTAWWLAAHLQRQNAQCLVDSNAMVVADGPIVTGGAAFAQVDVMLHLIRDHFGWRLADAISRGMLTDGRQAQGAYVVAEVLANGDSLVSRLVERVESSLPEPPSVARLARDFGISERTLTRRVHAATGRSTNSLVQSVKLRRARMLLEQTRQTVEEVAAAVGYSDATALRRMMKKVMGRGPSGYRPAIGAAGGSGPSLVK